MKTIAQTYFRPSPDDDDYTPAPIRPLNAEGTLAAWQIERQRLLTAWRRVVGRPAFEDFDRSAECIGSFEQPDYVGTMLRQSTTPENGQSVLVMTPKRPIATPCPGMVVPFYDPDRMAGLDLKTLNPLAAEESVIQFGRHLAALGFIVVCPEAYPFNTVPEPADSSGMNWWQAAADQLRLDHPDWTGVGRLAWDASRALDLLLEQPGIDAARCGIIGHSLGGKIAFYAAALDSRFSLCISSDFGIGLDFTNWDDDWYLGDLIHRPDFERAHHELLALMAPRGFFLVGGEADRPASWQYIQEAQRVYALYGREDAAGFYHHGAGHRPPVKAMRVAYAWLAEQFGLDVKVDALRLQET